LIKINETIKKKTTIGEIQVVEDALWMVGVMMVVVEGVVVVVAAGVPLEGEPFLDGDGDAEGAAEAEEEALTLTESFMPLAQCAGTTHMK
jgi:hypothetical protein